MMNKNNERSTDLLWIWIQWRVYKYIMNMRKNKLTYYEYEYDEWPVDLHEYEHSTNLR